MKLLTFLLLLLATLASSASGKDESLGSWYERAGTAFERTIEILRSEKGLIQRSRFSNGDVVDRELSEKTPQDKDRHVFFVIGSRHGDACAIRTDGDLDLFDSEGPIRRAVKRPKK